MTMLVAGGCDGILGIEALPPAPYADAACKACVEPACANELDACTRDLDCAPIYACLALCSVDDPECRAACERAHAAGVGRPAIEALEACRRTACVDACIGDRLPLPVPYDEPSCRACLAKEPICGELSHACVGDLRCEHFYDCESGCGDPDCLQRCKLAAYGIDSDLDPESTAAFEYMRSCWESCADACPVGTSWGCLDFVPEKPPLGSVIQKWGTVLELFSAAPLKGAQVEACTEFTSPCQPIPGVVSITGADGVYHLSLTVNFAPGFSGLLRVTGDGFATTHVLPQRPFNGSAFTGLKPPNLTTLQNALAALNRPPPDWTKAQIAIVASDCFGHFARGLTMSLAPVPADGRVAPAPLYGPGALDATDWKGFAFFEDVPLGSWILTATSTANGQPVEVGARALQLFGGELIFVNLGPRFQE